MANTPTIDDTITGLTWAEIALLGEALTCLRGERGRVWRTACDAAALEGRKRSLLDTKAIEAIRQLARRLGTGPTHWME